MLVLRLYGGSDEFDDYGFDDNMLQAMISAADAAESSVLNEKQQSSFNQQQPRNSHPSGSCAGNPKQTNQWQPKQTNQWQPKQQVASSNKSYMVPKKSTQIKEEVSGGTQKTLWDFGKDYIIPGTKKESASTKPPRNQAKESSVAKAASHNPFSVAPQLPPTSYTDSMHECDEEALKTWVYPTNYSEREVVNS
jgi:hypothetical protein